MKYVVDASVAVRWEIVTPDSPKALRLRADYQNRIHELFAPETIVWETANSLLKAERRKNIPAGDAELLYHDFLRSQPILCSASVRGPGVENRSANACRTV
jgi:predicted nucleic acid-binding protein